MTNNFYPFTATTYRLIKQAERLTCHTSGEDIYLTNGYWVLKMDARHYQQFQPGIGAAAGNWHRSHGKTGVHFEPADVDLEKVAASFDGKREPLEILPLLHTCTGRGANGQPKEIEYRITTTAGGTITTFNPDFLRLVDFPAECVDRSGHPAAVWMVGAGFIAAALPVIARDDAAKIIAAARAYLVGTAEAPAEETRRRVEEFQRLAEDLEAERNDLTAENARLQSDMEVLKASDAAIIADLREKLEAAEAARREAPAPAEEAPAPQPEAAPEAPATPAERAAAIAAKMAALNITATVKGAQTAAQVVWLSGDTADHIADIEAAGGKWSVKRAAWYVKI